MDYVVNLNNIVKSVNGELPDLTGNVTITIPNPNTIYTASDSQVTDITVTGAGFALRFTGQSGIRFDPNVGIGDAAQPNIKLQAYTNTLDKTISAGNDTSGGKAVEGVAGGANGFGAQFTAQGSGGTGMKSLGNSVGVMGQTTDDNGTAMVAQGAAMVKDWDDNSARLDASLIHLKSTTKATYFQPITKAQRDAIAPSPGMQVFMEEYDITEPEGMYVYTTASGWARLLTDV